MMGKNFRQLCGRMCLGAVLIILPVLQLSMIPLRAEQAAPVVLIASTTSTDNAGLLGYIQPKIAAALGIQVRFIVTGTGKALRLGENKDVDLLWVHDEQGEQEFMRRGSGLRREYVMHNHFVLVGPADDPAQAGMQESIVAAMKRIQQHRAMFLSRGDDSGTHRRERDLWYATQTPPFMSPHENSWYREAGHGMGATLNMAAAIGAYTISDEATWARFANRRALRTLLRDDARLFNPYSVIVVADTGRLAQTAAAQRVVDWLISPQGQQAINAYRINTQQVFFVAATPLPQ